MLELKKTPIWLKANFSFMTNEISHGSICIVCALQGEFYEAVHRSSAAGYQLFIPASPLCIIFLL